MQQPTLQSVRVRSTRDALQIFYAVARGVLPMITRRLDAEERRAIVPGNVYIWEERCANAEITGLGMERWTDGISWSASRIAQEFLFYRQRDSDQDSAHPSNQWANIMKRRDPRSTNPRSEVDRLIKQTYSVHVSLPEDRPRGLTRKWHLTAYFSQATLDSLNTIDTIPGVGDVQVPQGWFKNARASKARQGDNHRDDDNSSPLQDPWASVEPMTTTFRAQFSLDDDDKRRWTSNVAPPPAPPPHDRRGDFSPAHPPAHTPTTSISHPGRLPPAAEAARDYYRDPSPFTSQSSSSTSSEVDASPRAFSAPSTPPVPASFPQVQVAQHQTTPDRSLVPLSVLTSIRQPVRDPIAEDCLRRLSGTPRLENRWPDSRTPLPS
ncbi:uncharacterized protein PHACADRAFT_254558 [Phanerochaete carnosa HHB-10118-sp]|uniref:cAMP-independent regulatory protein pac2 n=1 Tax=Phanerochaete carnosa (strain HHB-10118-sp) TaxID=650164 RepID=K5X2K9_PHACS|nr:uncharacterized protein PHACADRAFT_254558 [Phanerochaete carnosa HHB-10118-sp]EKM57037.1 hypothetical protein PHACADRAFT_254558 [Phanerochaete carnosa HHB-10118-sp]